jgi:hypothetical protein
MIAAVHGPGGDTSPWYFVPVVAAMIVAVVAVRILGLRDKRSTASKGFEASPTQRRIGSRAPSRSICIVGGAVMFGAGVLLRTWLGSSAQGESVILGIAGVTLIAIARVAFND